MASYAEIVEIVVPSGAVAGAVVRVEIKVKNIYSGTMGIAVTAVYGTTQFSISPGSANVGPGVTQSFYGSFVMPSSAVTITAYSWWYGSDGLWHLDDQKTQSVSLTQLAPSVGGFTISDYVKV